MPGDPQQDSTTRTCHPQHPCNRFVSCRRCGARRQARWADVAERIERAFGTLHLAVIQPDENTSEALERAKRAAMRMLNSPAYIWSVEVGAEFGHLHLNLLGRDLSDLNVKNAKTHVEKVRTGARNAAAYITKTSAYPPRGIYPGRAVGSAGHVMQFLAQAGSYPVVQAATFLQIMETARFNRLAGGDSQKIVAADLRTLAQQFGEQLKNTESHMIRHMRQKGTITGCRAQT